MTDIFMERLRDAFEHHFRAEGVDLTRSRFDPDRYAYSVAEDLWEGYRACARSLADTLEDGRRFQWVDAHTKCLETWFGGSYAENRQTIDRLMRRDNDD